MKVVVGDYLNVNDGFLVQQVNCKNKIHTKNTINKRIFEKYPEVEKEYHDYIETCPHDIPIFGSFSISKVNKDFFVLNSFSQFDFGDTKETNLKYTKEIFLVDNIISVSELFYGKKVYIPWKIGCTWGGGDWNYILEYIHAVDNLILAIPENQLDELKEYPKFDFEILEKRL